jgi:hypothetical protein
MLNTKFVVTLMRNLSFIPIITLLLISLTSCKRTIYNDYVFHEFSWLISRYTFLQQPTFYEIDWLRGYHLNDEQLEILLKNDFSEQGYLGWKKYKKRHGFGNSCTINGYLYDVRRNLKGGYKAHDEISMYIDLTNKIFILFYGYTSGY